MISLVGLPGGGKSTVGRQLARRLGLEFVDSDVEIEKRLGCAIRVFFEREGEAAFRDVEQDVITTMAGAANTVLATGGGSVLREPNRMALRERSTVVYLRSTPEDLIRRLRHDMQRPLLQVRDPLARLRDLQRERDPLYRDTAHFTIDTGRPSVSTLVNVIVMQLELAGVVGRNAASVPPPSDPPAPDVRGA